MEKHIEEAIRRLEDEITALRRRPFEEGKITVWETLPGGEMRNLTTEEIAAGRNSIRGLEGALQKLRGG